MDRDENSYLHPISRQHGKRHGAIGFVSVVLALKLLVTKGFLFINDLVLHQFFKAPIQLLLVELPFSVFGAVGNVVIWATGIAIPAHAAGLVIAYPVIVAFIVAVVERPSPKFLASYWLGASVITATSVAASLGIAPDPWGIGSRVANFLQHHIVAELLREGVFTLGRAIRVVGKVAGLEIDESVGLIIAVTVVAFVYGVMWEKHVGHE